MKYSGARIVIECLVEQGVDTVFGYPGGAILNIYDELYKHQDRIRHILTAHEQGASHAADGYSRASGKVGVMLATSGPGATNLVTGIATAYMDSSPLVAITCNVAENLLGKDSFQEVDIAGITMPITKHNYIVRDVTQLATTIREAFIIAASGRQGPVLIDIPKNVTAALAEYEPFDPKNPADTAKLERASRIRRVQKTSDAAITDAAEQIKNAKRPFLYVGGGVISADASAELLAFAESAQIPVSVSLMGKSAFPSTHPLCCGMIGMHGTKAANTAANKADLIIAVGARFSDRVISDPSKFARSGSILHIDIDAAEINKNVPARSFIIGDVKDILSRLIPLTSLATAKSANPDERAAWVLQAAEWKTHFPSTYVKNNEFYPKFVFDTIHKTLGDDVIIVTDVGQQQMWTAQFYPFSKPRTFLTSGGLGTMGFSMGAAIGAQLAKPERPVAVIVGDGGFRMNCNELSTVAHYDLPITIVVMNNGVLGMVRQWQNLFYEKRFSQTTLDFAPDFVKLADAYGIRAFRTASEAEFDTAFKAATRDRKASLIDCTIKIDEMVLPMVPAGKPIDELLLEL